MWVDLLTSELRAKSATHDVTRRALIYLDSGLTLEQVLDALKISRATWYRRVEAMKEFHAEGQAAARRMDQQREEEIEAGVERLTSTNE